MKIHILSDLHIEFQPFDLPAAGADVIVLAGDINVGAAGVEWALDTIKTTPVVYVLGNHEYFRYAFPDLCNLLKNKARGTHVHVLENDSVEIRGVRFLGCTLWTDFMLNGDPALARFDAERTLADYHAIRITAPYRKLRAADTVAAHERSRAWLQRELADQTLPTVVVTHHAPATGSIAPQYNANMLNPAFISNMDELVAQSGARCWIHGHTHSRFDYMLGDTRVLCNPRGYPNENTRFDPGFVAEV
jgi:predicted phosphodiesterase